MERIEQMFWHQKGLVVALPVEATRSIVNANRDGETLPVTEGTRLQVISDDSVLNKRYPSIAEGAKYMDQVDTQWGEHLYGIAESMAERIKQETEVMGKRDIAIVLFGSVAKRLTKTSTHPDPSNVDMAVIDQFSDEEKTELFDRIRPYRKQWEPDIRNNVGVHIHHIDKLRANNYYLTVQYIGSSGRALYDPAEIWQTIEQEALVYTYLRSAYKAVCKTLRTYRREFSNDEIDQSTVFQELWETKIQPVRDMPISDIYLERVLEKPCLIKKGRDRFMEELNAASEVPTLAAAS